MVQKNILITGFILAGLGVVFGAFGAHALKETLGPKGIGIWETGHLYHMFHALGLIFIGIIMGQGPSNRYFQWAYYGMLSGIICFSGSLYLLALQTPWSWLGPITPLGGVLFIIAWTLLVIAVIKQKRAVNE